MHNSWSSRKNKGYLPSPIENCNNSVMSLDFAVQLDLNILKHKTTYVKEDIEYNGENLHKLIP